jgi:hypothetical protein
MIRIIESATRSLPDRATINIKVPSHGYWIRDRIVGFLSIAVRRAALGPMSPPVVEDSILCRVREHILAFDH